MIWHSPPSGGTRTGMMRKDAGKEGLAGATGNPVGKSASHIPSGNPDN